MAILRCCNAVKIHCINKVIKAEMRNVASKILSKIFI